MMMIANILVLLGLSVAGAQTIEYVADPAVAWTAIGGEIGPGNGIFPTPDGTRLVVTFQDGSVKFLDPGTGETVLDDFAPESLGFSIRGFGGVSFAYERPTPYMVYAVTDDVFNRVNAKT
jgi:hypothetical protein